ncbi:MAG: sporulation integral membrane protein YtvI [Clostridia bacterium]|nr:sporulation integral membrane protein YtvI [Clostridia bacterium]
MHIEKRRRFIINFTYAAVIVLIVCLIFKYLLGLLLPFIIGFAVASLLNPTVRKISKRLSLSKKFVSFVAVLLFYATVGTLVSVICVKLFVAAGKAFGYLPDFYSETIAPMLAGFFEFVSDIVARFDNSAVSEYGTLFSDAQLSLGTAISALSSKAVGFISGVVANMPMFVLEIVLTVISTFFFAADYAFITDFLLSLIPWSARERLFEIKRCTGSVLFKYCRSYLLIFFVTFGELFLGLTVAGAQNPAASALLIAMFDILPIVGIGFILVPWGVIRIITGQIRFGVILLVVYAVMTVVRNIIEPKIVGKEVGLHPALTLIAMFVGTRLFGLVGLFGLPIGLSVAKAVYDCNKTPSD